MIDNETEQNKIQSVFSPILTISYSQIEKKTE